MSLDESLSLTKNYLNYYTENMSRYDHPFGRRLPTTLIIHWMSQLANAIYLLHSEGIIIRYDVE